LSRKAVEVLAQSCTPKPAFSADVQIAACLAEQNIYATDTRPEGKGPELFHTFDARTASDIDYSRDGWLRTYMAPFGHTTREVLQESISPNSVLFHYVRGNMQVLYHNRLYGHPRQALAWETSLKNFVGGEFIPLESASIESPPPMFSAAGEFATGSRKIVKAGPDDVKIIEPEQRPEDRRRNVHHNGVWLDNKSF
jgi:hypothetical protein